MSDAKDYEKYLKNEWFPGCPTPKTEWRQRFEAYMQNKCHIEPRPKPVYQDIKKPKIVKSSEAHKFVLRQRQTARRNMLLAKGLCTDCGVERASDKRTTCHKCGVLRNHRMRQAYRNREKAA